MVVAFVVLTIFPCVQYWSSNAVNYLSFIFSFLWWLGVGSYLIMKCYVCLDFDRKPSLPKPKMSRDLVPFGTATAWLGSGLGFILLEASYLKRMISDWALSCIGSGTMVMKRAQIVDILESHLAMCRVCLGQSFLVFQAPEHILEWDVSSQCPSRIT